MGKDCSGVEAVGAASFGLGPLKASLNKTH